MSLEHYSYVKRTSSCSRSAAGANGLTILYVTGSADKKDKGLSHLSLSLLLSLSLSLSLSLLSSGLCARGSSPNPRAVAPPTVLEGLERRNYSTEASESTHQSALTMEQ